MKNFELFSEDYGTLILDYIVFIDIDGVLNHMNTNSTYKFERESVETINILFNKYKINLVLSSSWKDAYPFSFMQKLFKDNGIKAPLIDKTSTFINYENRINQSVNLVEIENMEVKNFYTREYEILDWIKKFNPKHYLILDDFKMKEPLLEKHQVLTNNWGYFEEDMALRKKHLNKCYDILNINC